MAGKNDLENEKTSKITFIYFGVLSIFYCQPVFFYSKLPLVIKIPLLYALRFRYHLLLLIFTEKSLFVWSKNCRINITLYINSKLYLPKFESIHLNDDKYVVQCIKWRIAIYTEKL